MKHKHADLIHKWANGAKIEFYEDSRQTWICTESPTWNPNIRYRLKPTIKYKIALLKLSTGLYCVGYNLDSAAKEVENSDFFVKWLTDWIEVEV